ncbi:ComZ family protein [Shouchella lehensis]|uniref:Late competence protein n=1 Tax=Shouchella lehensis G1 TaxID=1246626 RepID=A0A060LZC6_9BACI|nr:ComZ family protein [Shouchella lehensis]AIC95110.1 late competence protein [Shouchella lehensis G1]
MTDQEKNMAFMQIAMKYVPEAKELIKAKGIELGFDDLQPMLALFTKVMNEAYELGQKDSEEE